MKPRPRTAREMLRQSAQCLDAAGLRGHADDLRTIADRFDAEGKRAQEWRERGGMHADFAESALRVLERLDADLGGTR